uniref:Uncharacterized protein n=1 Tax=Oryza glumipatula TaxID=40148 RepID=A0A0D9ZAI0_9ORYZ
MGAGLWDRQLGATEWCCGTASVPCLRSAQPVWEAGATECIGAADWGCGTVSVPRLHSARSAGQAAGPAATTTPHSHAAGPTRFHTPSPRDRAGPAPPVRATVFPRCHLVPAFPACEEEEIVPNQISSSRVRCGCTAAGGGWAGEACDDVGYRRLLPVALSNQIRYGSPSLSSLHGYTLSLHPQATTMMEESGTLDGDGSSIRCDMA